MPAILTGQKYRTKTRLFRFAAHLKNKGACFAAIGSLMAVLTAAGCIGAPAGRDTPGGQTAKMRFASPSKGDKSISRVKRRVPPGPNRAAGRPVKIPVKAGRNYSRIGRASWYGQAFQGKRTANGEIFDMRKLTAAHRTMPLPSYARITNLKNGSSVIVRVNDRGPYAHNRLIDLSQRAAQLLGYHRGGLADVKVDYVGPAPAKADDKADNGATG